MQPPGGNPQFAPQPPAPAQPGGEALIIVAQSGFGGAQSAPIGSAVAPPTPHGPNSPFAHAPLSPSPYANPSTNSNMSFHNSNY